VFAEPGSTFDLQPTLTGSLLHLRPLQLNDFKDLFDAANDPLIWDQHPEPDRCKPEAFRRFFETAIASKGAFAVRDVRSGKIIGSSRYYAHNPAQREVTIGYTFLQRAYWGGMYNGELKQLMLDYAFRFVDRVLFEVGENNFRSQHALAKIGARFLTRSELPALNGTAHPCLVFVIERRPAPFG
jgi:RimJ/RimL family protein N-acetyltransferase